MKITEGTIELSAAELGDMLRTAAEMGLDAAATRGDHTETGIAYDVMQSAGLLVVDVART